MDDADSNCYDNNNRINSAVFRRHPNAPGPGRRHARGVPGRFDGNITANGVAIRIKGGSWFGLQGRHEPSNDATNPSGAPLEQYMGNVFWAPSGRTYMQDVNEFKAMGINVVRIPVSPQTLTGTDPQGMAPYLKNDPSVVIPNSLLALQTVIKDLDSVGIYVLLDIHSCSNYVDWRKGRLDARPPYVDATRDNYDFKREDSSCAATNNPSTVTRIQAYDETKWLADLRTLAGMEVIPGRQQHHRHRHLQRALGLYLGGLVDPLGACLHCYQRSQPEHPDLHGRHIRHRQ